MSSLRANSSLGGFSLIELTISIALFTALILGVIKIYMGNKQTSQENILSRMQEDANHALDILTKDIRNAGYLGCNNLHRITPNVVSIPEITNFYTLEPVYTNNKIVAIKPYTIKTAFTGNQNVGAKNWSPPLPKEVTQAIDNTDVMTVKSAGHCTTTLAKDMANRTADVIIANNNCKFSRNDVVLISDCSKADIFHITNTPGTSNRLGHANLGNSYTREMGQVMSFTSTTYFIGYKTNNRYPMLFAQDNTKPTDKNNPVVLVKGVENMQIEYGIDTNNDREPEHYRNANRIDNWGQVISARITLLLRSPEDMGAAPYVFNVGGNRVTYNGGELHKEYTATIKLRYR